VWWKAQQFMLLPPYAALACFSRLLPFQRRLPYLPGSWQVVPPPSVTSPASGIPTCAARWRNPGQYKKWRCVWEVGRQKAAAYVGTRSAAKAGRQVLQVQGMRVGSSNMYKKVTRWRGFVERAPPPSRAFLIWCRHARRRAVSQRRRC